MARRTFVPGRIDCVRTGRANSGGAEPAAAAADAAQQAGSAKAGRMSQGAGGPGSKKRVRKIFTR